MCKSEIPFETKQKRMEERERQKKKVEWTIRMHFNFIFSKHYYAPFLVVGWLYIEHTLGRSIRFAWRKISLCVYVSSVSNISSILADLMRISLRRWYFCDNIKWNRASTVMQMNALETYTPINWFSLAHLYDGKVENEQDF